METTRVSTKGQIVIPKEVRRALHWGTGKELVVVRTEDGVLLKSAPTGTTVPVDSAYGSLRAVARAKPPTDAQKRAAVRKKAAERYARTTGAK